MELFKKQIRHILPCDGSAIYYGKQFSSEQADRYFDSLLKNIAWQHDQAVIFGKHIITKRKTAWYGDTDYDYTYSNITRKALPWTADLLALKQLAEAVIHDRFNSCLLNLYHNGEEGVGWHSDDEKTLGDSTTIASLSFGAERKFVFRHKQTKETTSLILEHGSLLVMKDETQKHWLHSLPKSKKIMSARVNLTFRKILVD